MPGNIDYRHIDVDRIPYEPKNWSKLSRFHINCVKKVCIPSRRFIDEAERMLFLYNSERCEMAPFFFAVSEHARRPHGEKKEKGIAITFPKQNYGTDKLKNIRGEIKKLHGYLERRVRFRLIGVFAIIGVLIASAVAGVYPALQTEHSVFVFIIAIVIYAVMLICTVSVSLVIGSVENSLGKRLKRAVNEKCIQYFDEMYERLEFVGKKKDNFLYTIKKSKSGDELSYFFFGLIYKSNDLRSFMQKKLSSYKNLWATV